MARGHENGFGAIRLVLASLVIACHAPQLLDGSNAREPLSRLFGTITLGQLAVDGFFIVSGYLVTGSYLRSTSKRQFLGKRARRIVPGYLAAYLASLLIVAPLAGADLSTVSWVHVAGHITLLDQPALEGAFAALPVPMLNGAMWTIGMEARCYLLAIGLGAIGLYRNRTAHLAATAALVALAACADQLQPIFSLIHGHPWGEMVVLGQAEQMLRLIPLFMAGGAMRLWQPRVSPEAIAASAFGLILALSSTRFAETGVAALGAYLLIVAGRARLTGPLMTLNKVDVSYGTYLYAWPIMQLFILYGPEMQPAELATVTWVAAMACGWLSWRLVEQPVMQARRHRFESATQVPGVPPAVQNQPFGWPTAGWL